MSLSPCCRFHPAEVNIRIGQSSAAHAAFALRLKARPSGILLVSASSNQIRLLQLPRPSSRSTKWGRAKTLDLHQVETSESLTKGGWRQASSPSSILGGINGGR